MAEVYASFAVALNAWGVASASHRIPSLPKEAAIGQWPCAGSYTYHDESSSICYAAAKPSIRPATVASDTDAGTSGEAALRRLVAQALAALIQGRRKRSMCAIDGPVTPSPTRLCME